MSTLPNPHPHPHLHAVEHGLESALASEAIQTGQPQSRSQAHLPIENNNYHSGSINSTSTAAPTAVPSFANLEKTHSSTSTRHEPAHHAGIDGNGNVLEKTHSPAGEGLADDEGDGMDHSQGSGLLSGLRLYLVFISLMAAVFMFALDQSIVATAIPVIVSEFQAFDMVSWVITGYFLTQCGLILLVGQLLTVIKAKWMLLAAIFWFELGSLICAVAKGMVVLIVGRAIQGIGAAGMFVSILAVIAVVTKVEQRAAFMSAFGIVFVISSVVGPLLGGVFTERVSWRWCFWINLPFGGVAAAAVVFLLPARDPERRLNQPKLPLGKALLKMDYLGSAMILCCVTCLLLALQWGGNEYAWGSWRIILLFVLGGLLLIAFGAWQWYIDENALIPMIILKNRTEIASSGAMFMLMLAMLGGTYQLPLFYQAGRGRSPEQSGIDIIPFMLAVCIGIFVSGGIATATGRYWPFLVIGPPIAAVGFGLLYTITSDISNAKLIGYQILAGFGVGLAFQNALLAIQAEYSDRTHLVPQATGVISFFQLTGAAIGIGIVNTVQSVYLNSELKLKAPEAPFAVVRQSTEAIRTLPESMQAGVIDAYVTAITKSFVPIIVAVGLALFFGAAVRNHSLKEKGVKAGSAAA